MGAVLERARDFGHRSRRTLLLAGITGALVGLAVALFEWVTREQLLDRLLTAPVWVQAGAPTIGLVLTAFALRYLAAGASPATSEEYIKNFHEHDHRLDLRPVLGRVVASVATLGSGGALGFEGPSVYMGASIGSGLQARWSRFFSREDTKVLMVAGAAAGVAAIFKTPATGAIFALEVPYQDDTARHMLLPALLAAAVSYLVFVAFAGTTPLFAVAGSPPFDLRDLGGAVILGLACGAGARGFAWVMGLAKRLSTLGHPLVRAVVAGGVMAALILASNAIYGSTLAAGPGYRTLEWVTEPDQTLWLIVVLFALRMAAVATTVGGGGVGGLFVPLVVAGALTGKAAGVLVGDTTTTLFPVIGIAAFLGAGYRTPVAGVVFVAESTGRPGFVVPGLVAAVFAQLVMGDVSVSAYQQRGRVGHLERRFDLPINAAITGDTRTVAPDVTLTEFYDHHLLLNRQAQVPVVDGNRYLGMISLYDLHDTPAADWPTTRVDQVAHRDWPVASPSWTLRDAVRAMEGADCDALPVTDPDAQFIGLVTTADIVQLDRILGEP